MTDQKPTDEQRAEAGRLYEATPDNDNALVALVLSLIQARDSFMYASDKQAVAWKGRAEAAEKALAALAHHEPRATSGAGQMLSRCECRDCMRSEWRRAVTALARAKAREAKLVEALREAKSYSAVLLARIEALLAYTEPSK